MLSIKFKFYALLSVVTLALISLFIYADNQIIEKYNADIKIKAQNELNTLENRLTSNLYNNIHIAKGVPALFALNPNLSTADYQRAVKHLFDDNNQLRNIASAPDMVIKYMYPMQGNEAAVGLDYRKTPEQFETVDRAIKFNSILVAGPLELKQGGIGIITRFPLFLNNANQEKFFWGIISAVIDAKKLYQVSGLFDPDLTIDIAIRGKDGLGPQGEVFFGDKTLFNQSYLSTSINLPIGSWEMIAQPKVGWHAMPDTIWQTRLYNLIIVIIIFLLIASYSKAILNKYQANDKFRQLIEHSPIAYMLTNENRQITYVNKAFTDTFGYTLDDIASRDVWSEKAFPQKDYRDQVINEWHNYLVKFRSSKEIPDSIEFKITAKDGTKRTALVSLAADYNDQSDYPVVLYDITESKEYQQSLELMAHYDVLTGLPNRILLSDRYKQAVAHSSRTQTLLAICFLDLDDFKPVNDTYGHDIGDQLLVTIANSITKQIRDEDTIARIGGDEFVLLLGDLGSIAECEQLINRIHNVLIQPHTIDGHKITISASCGVTLYPNDNADLDTLMRHADQAMYQAKLAGKNRYQLFNAVQDKAIIEKQQRINDISLALERNQFRLYYQPKVNMKTGHVFGAEALIRWEHPEKGIIPPLSFLPLIDGLDLEIEIGNWVIETALEQIEHWHKHNIDLEVSVNISSFHLQSPNFMSGLKQALARHSNVQSDCLQLEILESSSLSNLSTISNIIKTCRQELGVHIALDDFGTGYSSLTHLRNLDADTIKIDQSFVRDVLDDPNDYSIIDGVISLANSFHRQVIAEGVETSQHGEILILMGCDQGQGYVIAHPMPAEQLTQWLEKYSVNQQWIVLANKDFSDTQKYMALLKLTLSQWVSVFEKSIETSTDSLKNLPNMDRALCHHGLWLKRLTAITPLNHELICQLQTQIEQIHNLALHIVEIFQQGDIDRARSNLAELAEACNKTTLLLQDNIEM